MSAIAVLERCKANYQQKQWDAGAFVLYNNDLAMEVLSVGLSNTPPTMDPKDAVGLCLLAAERNRESNIQCMTNYLGLL